jgi:2-polyprenyl-3-methyl-5-hydroxy-6-metoxy-1,4-benzoquinol methylase
MTDSSDELAVNRALWTVVNAQFTDARAREAWAAEDFSWGLFGNLESRLRVLGDVDGLDVVELGCGTAYVSAWLAGLGARPVGVDWTLPAVARRSSVCPSR